MRSEPNHRYWSILLALLIVLFTVGCSATDPAQEAQKVAVGFAEAVSNKNPTDYRVYMKGNLRAVDVYLLTFADEQGISDRPGEAWQKLHGAVHQQGHPLSKYDSSWKVDSQITKPDIEAKVTLSPPTGDPIPLTLTKDKDSWRIDWQKADPFVGVGRPK